MRFIVVSLIILVSSISVLGQTPMELSCLKSIRENSKDISFSKNKGRVTIKNDTIEYDVCRILLRSSSTQSFIFFKNGLLFPDLILGAGSNRGQKFKMSSTPFIGTLSISSFHELTIPGQSPMIKTFSFLLWEQNLANPKLYILEIINDKASSATNGIEFVEGSRLTGFGFCSVLI